MNEIKELINYIEIMIETDKINLLYLERFNNIIEYGSYVDNLKFPNKRLQANSDTTLKEIYDILKIKFGNLFSLENQVEPLNRMITPLIGDNTMLTITSDSAYDLNWFQTETKGIKR